MLTLNKIEKKNSTLPLMESFYSIQGEGYHQGRAAYFIRLGGCDVGCPWCDVKESWNADQYPHIKTEKIAEAAADSGAEIVVVTGGEPLMYDLEYLTRELHSRGMKTHLETSGAYPLSGKWDWICFSPKKFKNPENVFLECADELKIIICNNHDFEWAEEFAEKMNKKCKLYLQPEWTRSEKVIPRIIDYVKDNPEWEISLQIHKFMNIP